MSLRRRYDAFRGREIEFYKQVVSHPALMRLADVARERLYAAGTLLLGDMTLAFEVDDVVAERLRLPTFRVWSGRQFRSTGVRRSWSESAQQLALQIPATSGTDSVLLLQPRAADLWEAICASGRCVVVVEPEREDRERILEHADRSGWSHAVTTLPSPEDTRSVAQFASVFFSPAALADFAEWEADELIESLKTRTAIGGIHVVDGLLRDRAAVPRSMLRRRYADWTRRVQRGSRDWTLIAERSATAAP